MNPLLRWLTDVVMRMLRTVDLPLLGALIGLMAVSLVVMYSAGGDGMDFVLRQGARFAIGLVAMWAISRITPQTLRAISPAAYALSLLPLIAVLFIGTGRHGGHWINLGVFYFQPSELMKLSLPMMLAWYLDRSVLPPRFPTSVTALAIIALPVALILLQKDFGTAMLVMATGVFALFLVGLPWWWFGAGIAGVVAIAPIAWFWLLRPYQKGRIMTFLNPENDPLGEGWNLMQSKIAIGSGGWFGKGWGQGSQSHLDYLPEHTTDFAFSVLSEEFGWVGVMVVLTLYLFIIGRCLWIAAEAREGWSRIVAGTLGMALFAYVAVNGAMISGLLPVVGVPMPFISYGGTSAVALLAGMGLVMSAGAHGRRGGM
ncbi:rod shape-determining protein RodA [Solilutibacter tolerans]|uniref:Peptidoglycan glycosyltransferase MrdB n=1 Tax=Solilutibacter tolerans TaxID=1604334 RepID=A0A1N6QJV5_9GAMM|nr:rod shape-determining protein RodA [Lysobacter tolerans]SIQ16923.1 cell elongation-specific peptidoglycan biosynthesis regulator RodA [Lysobacter tolerans]